MSIELIIGAAVVVLLVAMYFKHREKPVDMDHKAPNVHNVVSKTPNGPKPAPAKKETPKAKAVAAKKPAKKSVPVSRMNKKDLMAHAKKQGAKVEDSMTKKEILDVLKNK